MQTIIDNQGIESRARRAAIKVGLRAEKARLYGRGLNEKDKFRIIDPFRNSILDCGLTPEQAIGYCESR